MPSVLHLLWLVLRVKDNESWKDSKFSTIQTLAFPILGNDISGYFVAKAKSLTLASLSVSIPDYQHALLALLMKS